MVISMNLDCAECHAIAPEMRAALPDVQRHTHPSLIMTDVRQCLRELFSLEDSIRELSDSPRNSRMEERIVGGRNTALPQVTLALNFHLPTDSEIPGNARRWLAALTCETRSRGKLIEDPDMMYMIPDLVCPECSVVAHCDYSKSYLREQAVVDGEVQITHQTATDWHMHTIKLNATQLAHIRDLLSNT
jgi:hypothetical protein